MPQSQDNKSSEKKNWLTYLATRKMDELDYTESNESNYTFCYNITKDQLQDLMILSVISVQLLVLVLMLQLFFICRYKSTFLHRQFLYTTIVVILLGIIYVLYPSFDDCSHSFSYTLTSLNQYLLFVEILQMTTIHIFLLYKLLKHIETRTMQRLRACCCNVRPRLWHEVVLVCFQFGYPIPLLITELVVRLSPGFIFVQLYTYFLPLVAINILFDLICIVLLLIWFYMLSKKKLLKSKAKVVCTQMGHILFVLVVFLTGNIIFVVFGTFHDALVLLFVIQTAVPVSFGVYILMSIPNMRKKVRTRAFATNHHTNPPSTRVSLPTDTAEHAPNFLSPSTAELSEVSLLVNN